MNEKSYTIIRGVNIGELERKVNIALSLGWSLFGAPFMDRDEWVYQVCIHAEADQTSALDSALKS